MATPNPDPIAYRVLVVEDNEADARAFAMVLRASLEPRLVPERVTCIGEALERLSRNDAYDVALLDLSLPDAEGLEGLVLLRSRAPHLPIVVLTGADEGLGGEAVRMGAQDYLQKHDVDPRLLVRSLHYALERSRLEERLAQAQRLEAIGRLAGGMAHDFNNLLAVVGIHADLLQRAVSLDSQLRASVEAIVSVQESAEALTRQLLMLSRHQLLSAQAVDMNAAIEQFSSSLRRTLPAGIELTLSLADGPLPVLAQEGQLPQVLLNLVMNAVDAMPAGGRIHLSTERRESGAAAGGQAAASLVRLQVTDTGSGIPVEARAHIFEPFFSTKPTADGRRSGMGLATVYGIVQQCGGEIRLESEVGQGTRFILDFPLSDTETAMAARSERILLLAEQISARDGLASMLSAGGFQVEVGREEEVDRFLNAQPAPDLIVLLGEEVADLIARWTPFASWWPEARGLLLATRHQPQDGTLSLPPAVVAGHLPLAPRDLMELAIRALAKTLAAAETGER